MELKPIMFSFITGNILDPHSRLVFSENACVNVWFGALGKQLLSAKSDNEKSHLKDVDHLVSASISARILLTCI